MKYSRFLLSGVLFIVLLSLPQIYAIPSVSDTYIDMNTLDIDGNPELDAFFAGNGTDGLSWGSAHLIENARFDGNLGLIQNTNRYLIIKNSIINQSTPSGFSGLYLSNCTNVRIENLLINNMYSGIRLDGCEDILLINNTISKTASSGIRLYYTNKTIIQGNDINPRNRDGTGSGNPNYAGMFIDHGNENQILNNTIEGQDTGINLISTCLNNQIEGNILIGNKFGVEAAVATEYNNFSRNEFYWNLNQAVDNSSKNNWTISGIGNYWTDYTGWDTDGDGIGDVSYYGIQGSYNPSDTAPLMRGSLNPVVEPEDESFLDKYLTYILLGVIAVLFIALCAKGKK